LVVLLDLTPAAVVGLDDGEVTCGLPCDSWAFACTEPLLDVDA